MPSFRLRTFLILSLVLHIVSFSMVAAFFSPHERITTPEPIKVGLINKYKDPGAGKAKSVELPPKEAPKVEKKIAKPVVKKKQKREKPEKKEIVSLVDKPLKEQSATESSQDNIDEAATDIISGMESSERGKGIGVEGTGSGVEIGYADYNVNPKPDYPMIARKNGFEGVVLLRVFVLEDGTVGKVELEKSSGYGMLDKSALDGVKDWIFIPGKRNGTPISSWVMVPIRFQLSGG
ncbi:MAG: TonB family protein [Thermodesulfobacteriota bacterium]